MTEPDEQLPNAGSAEPADDADLEAAEEYAENVPIDPAPDQVNEYLRLVGDPEAEPEPDVEALPDADTDALRDGGDLPS
jgi:hypothetical protein